MGDRGRELPHCRDPIGMGHLHLCSAERFLGALAFGNVDRRTHEFDETALSIEDRMPDIIDMFDRSIGQNNPEIVGVFSLLVGLPLDAHSHPVEIFRVNELPEFFAAAQTFLRI